MDNTIDFHEAPGVAAGRARGGRATQQDDLVCLHDPVEDCRLLVLADGMGGEGAGELASAGVVQVARNLWEDGVWRQQPGPLFLESLCQEAHLELHRRRAGLATGAPHSTVVALLIRGERVAWAHVGDSRLYRFRGLRLLGRTQDHSLAQLKQQRGELTEHDLATDADQHKLLRGLGGPDAPAVEHGCATLQRGQAFVLCSDGVWAQLTTEELGRLSRRRDQHEALHEALALAVERGGVNGDNVALILVGPCHGSRWRERGARLWSAAQRAMRMNRWQRPAAMHDEV